jgi:hypothetical protein
MRLTPAAVFHAAIILLVLSVFSFAHARMIDKVIAYVDDRAITYSELQEKYRMIKNTGANITEKETLDSMINALLMLQKAKKLRFEAPTEDDLIKEYLNVTIKARIVISEDQIREFYDKNRDEFKGREYGVVRADIEKYLTDLETNKKLKEHLKELRAGANIVIHLKDK